jgi:hypothetical protein
MVENGARGHTFLAARSMSGLTTSTRKIFKLWRRSLLENYPDEHKVRADSCAFNNIFRETVSLVCRCVILHRAALKIIVDTHDNNLHTHLLGRTITQTYGSNVDIGDSSAFDAAYGLALTP